MKMIRVIFFALIGVSLPIQSFADKDPNLGAIKARKAEMELRKFNAGTLFGMAKGKIEYNAEAAALAADNLEQLLGVNMGAAWPAGSGNDNYPADTRSLREIWSTYPEITHYGEQYAEAVSNLAETAGDGLDALRDGVGALGKSCKGCHDEFRAKK